MEPIIEYSCSDQDMRQTLSVILKHAASDEDLLKSFRDYLKGVGEDWGYLLPDDAKKMGDRLAKEYFIVDLRDAAAFKKSHVPGAINIFWKDILDPYPQDKRPVLS